jgi:PST family polysaccharide transporter
LGSRWEGVAPIFSILAFSGLFASVNNATGWLFISQNRTREMRNWGIISSMMFVLSFVIGLPWGPIGVAASYASFSVVQGPMVWWASTKQGPVSLNDIGSALFPFCLAGLAVFATVFGLGLILPAAPFTLVILFVAAYAVFIGILALKHEGCALFTDLREQSRHLLRRRKTI